MGRHDDTGDGSEAAAPGPRRMHAVSTETESLVDLVLDYSRRRILSSDTPLDRPRAEYELRRLAGNTIVEEGIGATRALELFENVLAPACITTDHPQYLSFIPTAPTKAATAFDLVVSASAVYGGSWLEGSGAVFAENEVLAWLAGEFGLPAGAGGVFVQGGTLGNLSALVAAREHARTPGRDGRSRRDRIGGRWSAAPRRTRRSRRPRGSWTSRSSRSRPGRRRRSRRETPSVRRSPSTAPPSSPSSRRRARRTSASSTTSHRSPPSRTSSTSGCTSTAPTGSPACSPRWRATISPGSNAPTRSSSTRTSGCSPRSTPAPSSTPTPRRAAAPTRSTPNTSTP